MTGRREELLEQLEAIAGTDRLDEALETAIEGAKLALSAEQLVPLVQAWSWLGILGMQPKPGEGFYAWSREHRLVTEEQWEEARKLDLLGMRPEHPCPVPSPVDGEACIRELHHRGRHVDENGWAW